MDMFINPKEPISWTILKTKNFSNARDFFCVSLFASLGVFRSIDFVSINTQKWCWKKPIETKYLHTKILLVPTSKWPIMIISRFENLKLKQHFDFFIMFT